MERRRFGTYCKRLCGNTSASSVGSVNFERRPSPYRTSFAVDEIDVRLGDGQSLPIIFKDLSPHQLLGEARLAPTFLRHPHRELEVYRSLLEPEELGTPACYGTVCSDADQRYWLFLERIPGVQLGQVGDFEAWEEAARWIARLHMRFAHATDGQLGRARATSSLLTHDASFYRRWAARALTYLMQTGSACSEDTVRQFTPLANDYDRVVRRLVSLDRTLIHGEFYASNILVTQFDGAPQVSPVDWEMAAVGPGLVDLAALASGWSEPNRRPLALGVLRNAAAHRPRLAGYLLGIVRLLPAAGGGAVAGMGPGMDPAGGSRARLASRERPARRQAPALVHFARRWRWRPFAAGLGLAVGLTCVAVWLWQVRPAERDEAAISAPTPVSCAPTDDAGWTVPGDDRTLRHVLDRLGYGPRPIDLDRVRRVGAADYMASQLSPEHMVDDTLRVRLDRFETQRLTTAELVGRFYLPAVRERLRDRLVPRTVADVLSQDMTPQAAPDSGASAAERLAFRELSQQKLLRAIYSERQL